MKNFRSLLALLAVMGCGASAFAQFNDNNPGVVGNICEAGRPCPLPGNGNGGGAPVDPSPYDPQPGYPGNGGGPGQPHHPHPGPGPGYPGQPGNPYPGNGDRREVYVGRNLGNQTVDLIRLLNLYNAQGSRVRSVEVMTRPSGGYAQIDLGADQSIEDSQSTYNQTVVLNPRRDLILGQTVQNLFLGFRGNVFVDRIAVNLDRSFGNPGPGPGPGNGGEFVLPAYVGQTFYQPVNLDVLNASGASRYRGYQLTAVTFYGQALNYPANVRVVVDGRVVGGFTLQNMSTAQPVYFPGSYIIGQNVNSLNLYVDGQSRVDRIEVRLRSF